MPAKNTVNVARVQQLIAQGVTQKAISLRLGVAQSAVSQIAAGKYLVKEAK